MTSVTFTWAYTARPTSELIIGLDYTYILETPGGLEAHLTNGAPDDTVTLSIVGGPTDFQTITLDTLGNLTDFIVRVPALAAGDYTLHVEGLDSGSTDLTFTALADALSHEGTTPPALDTPPVREPATHWRFYDLRDPTITWTFPRNPKTWTNVFPPNDFTHDNTVAVDGLPLTWQAAARPWRLEFSGWLNTEEEYNQLVFWSQLHRRFWLIDHRNRAWLITIEQFDATALVKPHLPWAHEYTVKTLVFMQATD